MKKWRIFLRVLVVVALAASLLGVSVLSGYLNRSRELTYSKQYVAQLTEKTINNLQGMISDRLTMLQMAAHFYSEDELTSQISIESLKHLKTQHLNYDHLGFVTPDGRLHNEEGDTADCRDRQYFLDGMQGKSDIMFIDVPRIAEEPLLAFYGPVYRGHDGTECMGVLVATIRKDRIADLLNAELLGYPVNTFLVRQDGTIVSRSANTENIPMENVNELQEMISSDTDRLAFTEALRGHSAADFEIIIHEQNSVGHIHSVTNTEWSVVQLFPVQASRLMRANSRNDTVKVLGLTHIVALAIAAYLFIFLRGSTKREAQRAIAVQREKANAIGQIQQSIIQTIANLVESRDDSTGHHIRKATGYVQLLVDSAYRSGKWPVLVDEQYRATIVKAAALHDIGKIAIPDSILQKPGKLTDEEFEIMKTHAAIGADIIRRDMIGMETAGYVDVAERIARYHHERWDGTGYPAHLQGDEIPLQARIMAIADVFDALTSNRCYKAAYTVDKAMDIIRKETGTHFDPQLGKLFLSMQAGIRRLAEEEDTVH